MRWLAGESEGLENWVLKKEMGKEKLGKNVIYTSCAFFSQKRCQKSPNNFLRATTLKM